MKRHIGLLMTVLLLLAFALPTAAQEEGPPRVGLRPDAPEYALHGPYWVGTREFVIDPDSERPLPLTVWYPALNPDAVPEEVTYVYDNFVSIEGFSQPGHALSDAAPDDSAAPYPLVILSHGTAGYRYALSYLAEHLASHGFVAFSADHTGNTLATAYDPQVRRSDWSGFFEGITWALVQRPSDIQRLIDYAVDISSQGGDLPGIIDGNQIGVIGHSFGGFTAMASAGGRLDLRPWRVWCDDNATNASVTSNWIYTLACNYILPEESSLLASLSSDAAPGELWPPYDVVGVDAIVPLAPGQELQPEGLEQLTVPALFIVGENDSTASPEAIAAYYETLTSDRKGLVEFERADHYFHASTCGPWFSSHQASDACGNDAYWDMDRAHDLINHFTTAFLLDVLKGDTDAHAALAPSAVSFPGITYETEGF